MNNPSRLRRSFIAAVSLCTVSASALFAAEPSLDRLIPAETALVVSLRDLPSLNVRFAESAYGRAWADPEIARFFAPLTQHPKLAAFLEKLQADTGLSLREISELLAGDVMLALPKIDFAKPDKPSVLVAMEVGDKESRLAELITASIAKSEVPVTREDYNGVELFLAREQAEDATVEAELSSVWALHQGRWFIGSDRAAVTGALDALAAGGLTASLADSPDYLRLLGRAKGKVEMLAHFNFRAVYPALLASVEAQRDPAAPPNMFGIEPAAVMQALGLDAIEGLSMVSSHGEDTDHLVMTLNYSENRGLVRLLAYKDGPVAKPDWMPASWFNVSSQTFSLVDFYSELEVLLDRVSPLLAGMAQGQVKTFERKLGIDLKRDFFGSTGTAFVSGFADPAGANPERATPYDELDQFIGISLADAPTFERAVEAIKGAFLPPGDAGPLQTREYLGRKIYSFTPPVPGAKGVSYAISDGWLMIGIGTAGTIESAIQLQAAPNAELSFWRRADVRAATDGAPAGALSLQHTELAPLFASLASFLVKLQEQQTGEDAGRFVDPAALPSRELIGRYFKHVTGYSVRTAEGLLVESEGPSK